MIFKVKKLSKYKKAKYPDYTEPEKLDFSRYSFPFARCAKLTMIASAIVSGLAHSNDTKAEQSYSSTLQEIDFTQQLEGDIIERAPTLSGPKVFAVVKEIFNEAGLDIKENVLYKDDKVQCEIDIYDKNKKIGFEYLTLNDKEYNNPSEKKYTAQEREFLSQGNRKNAARVLIVDEDDFSYTPNDKVSEIKALLKLEEAVRQYIKQLKEQGAL